MDKSERQSIMESFRNADTRVLISSDITARGIDVQQVSVVVNFDITSNVNTYLHRIGRSGRWGRKGFAINLVTQRDIQYMRNIEKHYSITIDELPKNFMCTV
jgi:superfamily II DNA/RNA helicase